MKINLTTTTITPPAESLLTFEQLKEAASGVYLCHTHRHENPSQRIIKDGEDLFLCGCRGHGGGFIMVPDDSQEEAGCRFMLAPEQVVNITFEKEAPPKCSGTITILDEYVEQEKYLAGQAASGLKPGDKVRVTRAASSHECGWDNAWTIVMTSYVGRGVYTVHHINDYGISLEEDSDGTPNYGVRALFPFFVLEKVAGSSEINRGDRVRVLRIPTNGERGWTDNIKQLDGMVGGVFEVARIYNVEHAYKKSAVFKGNGFALPFFVLEKVS